MTPLFGKNLEEINSELVKFCLPLYFEVNEGETPQLRASSTLLNHVGENYLVTAAHVGASLFGTYGPPFVPCRDWSIRQFQYVKSARTADQGLAQPDIEFIHLLDEVHELTNFVRFAPTEIIEEISNQSDQFNYFVVIGFAASKNKRPRFIPVGKTIKKPSSTTLSCNSHPNSQKILAELGYHPGNHLVVNYKRRSFLKNGVKIMGPDPHGISGGSVFGIKKNAERAGSKTYWNCHGIHRKP